MNRESLWDEYEQALRSLLPFTGGRRIDADDSLSDLGLDSLTVIQLIGRLESDFTIEFPDTLLHPETFATAGSLHEVVSRLVTQQSETSIQPAPYWP